MNTNKIIIIIIIILIIIIIKRLSTWSALAVAICRYAFKKKERAYCPTKMLLRYCQSQPCLLLTIIYHFLEKWFSSKQFTVSLSTHILNCWCKWKDWIMIYADSPYKNYYPWSDASFAGLPPALQCRRDPCTHLGRERQCGTSFSV